MTHSLLLLEGSIYTHGVLGCSALVLFDWQVRPLKVVNVNNIVNFFATMLADELGVCILQLLVVLNCEVLPLDLFFEFFSLTMALEGLLDAILDLTWVFGLLAGFGTSIGVHAVLELVTQVEIASVLGDLVRCVWVHVVVVWTVVSHLIEGLAPKVLLLLFGTLFGTMAES